MIDTVEFKDGKSWVDVCRFLKSVDAEVNWYERVKLSVKRSKNKKSWEDKGYTFLAPFMELKTFILSSKLFYQNRKTYVAKLDNLEQSLLAEVEELKNEVEKIEERNSIDNEMKLFYGVENIQIFFENIVKELEAIEITSADTYKTTYLADDEVADKLAYNRNREKAVEKCLHYLSAIQYMSTFQSQKTRYSKIRNLIEDSKILKDNSRKAIYETAIEFFKLPALVNYQINRIYNSKINRQLEVGNKVKIHLKDIKDMVLDIYKTLTTARLTEMRRSKVITLSGIFLTITTGRRIGELVRDLNDKATFKEAKLNMEGVPKLNNLNQVAIFWGQEKIKAREREQFPIPLLFVGLKEVLEVLRIFRETIKPTRTTKIPFDKKPIQEIVRDLVGKTNFGRKIKVNGEEKTEWSLINRYTKDSSANRALYASINSIINTKKWGYENYEESFIRDILGHSKADKKTYLSYKEFEVIDDLEEEVNS